MSGLPNAHDNSVLQMIDAADHLLLEKFFPSGSGQALRGARKCLELAKISIIRIPEGDFRVRMQARYDLSYALLTVFETGERGDIWHGLAGIYRIGDIDRAFRVQSCLIAYFLRTAKYLSKHPA